MKKLVVVIIAAVLAFGLSGTAIADTLAGGSIAHEISGKKACEIALKNAGLTKCEVAKLKIKDEKQHFEVEFTKKRGGTMYEYDVAKNGGKILEKEIKHTYKHCCSTAKIGKATALKLVAKRLNIKLSVVKKGICTYRYSNHEGRYKVKFRYKGFRFSCVLLAPNGKLLEWERECIRR